MLLLQVREEKKVRGKEHLKIKKKQKHNQHLLEKWIFFFLGNLTMVLYREADHVDVANAVALEALTTPILTSQGCPFGLPKPSRNSCIAPSITKNMAGTRQRSG